MENQTIESPVPGLMKYSEQLAVMLTIQACVKTGKPYVEIVRRLRDREVSEARKQAWDQFIAQVEQPTNFGIALADTGLFSPDVENILAVVNEAEHAPATVIEYLRIIVNRNSGLW